MLYIQCTVPTATTVSVPRPHPLSRLVATVYTPIPVPENKEEKESCGKRFIPFQTAKQMVETTLGAWQWCDHHGNATPKEDSPRSVLSGPIPAGFPHAETLKREGITDLSQIPKSMNELAAIPSIATTEENLYPSQGRRESAAREIIDGLNKITQTKEGI